MDIYLALWQKNVCPRFIQIISGQTPSLNKKVDLNSLSQQKKICSPNKLASGRVDAYKDHTKTYYATLQIEF